MENNNELMPVGQLIKNSFELTKSKAKVVYALSGVFLLAWLLFALLIGGSFFATSHLGTNWLMSAGIVGVVGLIIFIIASIWIQVAILYAVVFETTVRDALMNSKQFFWKYLLTSLLAGLITAAGFVLLIVPGILFALWYVFANMVVVTEGLSGMAALKQSKTYVKGRIGQIFGRLFVLGVIGFVVQIILTLIFRGQLGPIASAIFSFVFIPFTLSYQYLLFKNAKETSGLQAAVEPVAVPTNEGPVQPL